MSKPTAGTQHLLNKIGVTNGDEMYAQYQAAERAGNAALAEVVRRIGLALTDFEDAERKATRALRLMTGQVDAETAKLAAGLQTDTTWIAQAARHYGEADAAMKAAAEDVNQWVHFRGLLTSTAA